MMGPKPVAPAGVSAAGNPVDDEARRMWQLERVEALRLLGSVSLGRVVFNQNAMPAIRLVNHLLDHGDVIIRTHLGAAVLTKIGEVVAYEADSIDPHTHLGWSVVVLGFARVVTNPEDVARHERMLRPWVSTQMDHVIRIEPQIVTGYALAASAGL